jgi:hypothetical protein
MILCKTCHKDVTNARVCSSQECSRDRGYLEWKPENEMYHNLLDKTIPMGWRLPTLSELERYGPILRNHREVRVTWYWSSTKDQRKPIMTKCYHLDSRKVKNYNISTHIWVCLVRDIQNI